MIKLKILIFTMILLGPCAFAYARRTRPVGRTLPAALCFQSLALIGLGYVLPFSAGVAALAAFGAASWLYALIRTIRCRSWKQAIFSLALPSLLFACCAVFLYDVCSERLFLSYDEHSHWGMIVKAIHLFDELPRAGQGASYIQFTYPPSTAMLPAMAASILRYKDGVAYFGYIVLIAGLIWGLAHRAGRGSWKVTLAACALVYLVMMAIFPLGMMRLFTEPVIALLMALLIMGGQKESQAPLWEDCLYALMLAMVKNTGLVFVAVALAARLMTRCDKKRLIASAVILAACVLAVGSYSVYCDMQGIGAVISPSHFAENMQALREGTLHEAYRTLPARFASFLFGYRLAQAGIYACYGFGTPALVLAATALLCAAHVAVARDRRQAIRMWRGVWLLNAAYLVMIAASYFFNFELWEVARLSEADRYTMLIALWTGVTACAALLGEWQGAGKKRYALLACACFAALLPLSHMEMTVKTFITREYVHNTVWARDMTDRMTAYVKSQLPGAADTKLLCMGESQYMEMHYTLAGHTDLGPVTQDWKQAAWSGDAEALAGELSEGGYTHVLVCGLGDDADYDEEMRLRLPIDERYNVLSEDGQALRAYSLYRVEHGQDGSVKLQYLSSMPEQEQ